MFLRIENLAEKKLAGKRMTMSLADNKTSLLWKSFMPERRNIPYTVGTDLYSLQQYAPDYFVDFNPNKEFIKWAAIEVTDFRAVPENMESFIIPAGLYAVFLHKGAASTGPKTFQYIFGVWLPASGYRLANRPHFERLGEAYKNEHPDSEEEIWIPIESQTKPKE